MSSAISRKVPLLDLKAQYAPIRDEILAEVTRVMDSQRFILGDEVAAFESEVARSIDAPYAVGCASGSDALLLALLGLDVSPGQRVITTPYTFFATAGAISHAKARPVFVDIDPETFNLAPALLAETLKRESDVHSVMPVHLYGGAAEMDEILAMAAEAGVKVIEDAAQAIGAEYKGRKVGTLGDAGCFSFFPSKNLGAFGDGGMVTTRSKDLAHKISLLRVHGRTGTYIHQWVGLNSRLDALQACVLRVKLRRLDQWTEGRQRNAALYRELLEGKGLPVKPPRAAAHQTRHIYNQFIIRCERRDQLRAFLAEQGIATEIYYPLPLHLQACYSDLGYREGDFPASEQASREALALPIYPELSREEIEYVADAIARFYC